MSSAPADRPPSDNTTLTAVLDELAADGYDTSFVARPGAELLCTACREERPVAGFRIDGLRRFEGASDPDAEVLLVSGTCPACGASGTIALGYGPEASEIDADLVASLPPTERT